MDFDERAGLQAFALAVGTGDGPEHGPAWIAHAGGQVAVEEIASSWREDERLGWRLRLADGSWWLLYHVPELNLWSGVQLASRARSGPEHAG